MPGCPAVHVVPGTGWASLTPPTRPFLTLHPFLFVLFLCSSTSLFAFESDGAVSIGVRQCPLQPMAPTA